MRYPRYPQLQWASGGVPRLYWRNWEGNRRSDHDGFQWTGTGWDYHEKIAGCKGTQELFLLNADWKAGTSALSPVYLTGGQSTRTCFLCSNSNKIFLWSLAVILLMIRFGFSPGYLYWKYLSTVISCPFYILLWHSIHTEWTEPRSCRRGKPLKGSGTEGCPSGRRRLWMRKEAGAGWRQPWPAVVYVSWENLAFIKIDQFSAPFFAECGQKTVILL